jgi:DNA-binding beta-propeller fold protein YncE
MRTLLAAALLVVAAVVPTYSHDFEVAATMTGLSRPHLHAVDPLNGRVFVLGRAGPGEMYRPVVTVDVDTRNEVASTPLDYDLAALSVNPVTGKVYIGGYGPGLYVHDGSTLDRLALILLKKGNREGAAWPSFAVNPVTNRVFFGLEPCGGVAVIDGETDELIDIIPTPRGATVWQLEVNPLTNRIYALLSGAVKVIDGASNEIIASLPTQNTGGRAMALDVLANRLVVLTTRARPQLISVYDGSTNGLVAENQVPRTAWTIVADPVTHRVYVAHYSDEYEQSIYVVDTLTGTIVDTFENAPAGRLAVDPMSGHLFSVSYYLGGVQIINGTTGSIEDFVEVDVYKSGRQVTYPPLNQLWFDAVGGLTVLEPVFPDDRLEWKLRH